MIKNKLLNIILIILILSCKYNYTNNSNKKKSMRFHNNLVLLLYPIGCNDESCISYKISIKKNEYRINGTYYLNYSSKKKFKIISKHEIEELDSLIQNIKNPYIERTNACDVWSARLIVNGKTVFEQDDFSFETAPEPFKKIIKKIIKLSPLEIKLYGFS